MTDKKVFAINPDLFSFSNTTKKKKKEQKPKNAIKMKQPVVKNNDTLRKRTILKMIRQHQENRNKQNFSVEEKPNTISKNTSNKEFELAKSFFDNMSINTKSSHNYTVKNNNSLQKTDIPVINSELENIQPMNIPTLDNDSNQIQINNNASISVPKYGCLKNGNLPTYRDYYNKTRKNNNDITLNAGGNNQNVSESFQKVNEMAQIGNKLKNLKKKKKIYRKKTVRKTFKLGRSKIKPVVSVLVSNKTIRNKTIEQTQLLKQVPITEIRTYLIRHGFIKVGTITPNDVLRKMYESALLICGDVQNYNKENLMYNFLNTSDEI